MEPAVLHLRYQPTCTACCDSYLAVGTSSGIVYVWELTETGSVVFLKDLRPVFTRDVAELRFGGLGRSGVLAVRYMNGKVALFSTATLAKMDFSLGDEVAVGIRRAGLWIVIGLRSGGCVFV